MENLANIDSKSSCPLVAIQNVMNNLLAQRDKQLSLCDRSSYRNRGSKLKNTLGLNMTDDEYVALKLKQKRYHKLHCSQAGATISAGKPGRKSKVIKNIVKNNAMNIMYLCSIIIENNGNNYILMQQLATWTDP